MKYRAPVHGLVPVAILQDPSITLADLKVYVVLASFQGSNDDAYPSREAIVSRCGLVVETISRSVKHLMELGWIHRVRRPNQTSIYRVMFESDDVSGSDSQVTSGSDRYVTPEVTPKSHPSISTKRNTEKEQYSQDSPPLILATLLMTEHRKHDPKFLVGKEHETTQKWAKDIERLIRLDERTPDEIRRVIVWCQSLGCFWAPNILSGAKLREKYPTLLSQSNYQAPVRESDEDKRKRVLAEAKRLSDEHLLQQQQNHGRAM